MQNNCVRVLFIFYVHNGKQDAEDVKHKNSKLKRFGKIVGLKRF
jgi:hypothetical protein